MFYDSCFSKEITDFRKLGTGRKRRKVVVVSPDRRILFISRILHSYRLTAGKIVFEDGNVFHVSAETVGGRKVSLFLWTEELQRRYIWQNEIERVWDWLETARPEDVIVCADLVAEESGMPKNKHHPWLVIFAKEEIKKRVRELGLVQLQRLAAMLYAANDQIAA
jgi:hypothetical protein